VGRIALVGAVGVIVACASVLAYANQPHARPLDLVGWILLLVSVAALGWVRERPEAVLVVSTLCVTGYFVLGYAYSVWPASPLIAMYTSIAQGRRGWGWAGAAFLFAVPAAGVALEPVGDNIVGLVIWALVVLTVAQLGEVSRARRAYTAEVERRAAEAERTREEEARRRAQEERLRIARELHDVTSHTVSLIALQAAVAAEAVERAGGPEEARAALKIIRTASREALSEMKGILTVLRTDDAGAGVARPSDGGAADGPSAAEALPGRGEPGSAVPAFADERAGGSDSWRTGVRRERADAAERQPMPGLGRLRELIAGAGVDVEFRTLGEERTLPPAVELTVYRLVQEALTNTRRHAQATRAWVTLSFERDGVAIRVADNGRGAPATPSGDAAGGRACGGTPEAEGDGTHTGRHDDVQPGQGTREPADASAGRGSPGDHRNPAGGGGLGLLGMRERVAAMNGRLTVGNRPGGGFQVEAWLPVEAA